MIKLLISISLLFSFSIQSETKLIVLGSGTPNPDPERYGSGYAVVVNDNAYIVDFGPGIVEGSQQCLQHGEENFLLWSYKI